MIKASRFLKQGNILGIVLLLLGICSIGFGFQEQVVPVVDGRLGGCSAEFTVTDANKTPIYDAKIDVTLRYGFLGLRKMSLQVGTNSDGRARVAGLPDDDGKTFQFEVTSGTLHKTVFMNTSDKCKAEFEVMLNE
jgi:hypothetical protein